MNKREAMQVFDGLLLGDGGLTRGGCSAYFYIGLSAGDPNQWRDTPWGSRSSKIPQIQYLWHIRDCLEPLGIEFSENYPKAYERISEGKPFLCCELHSLTSDFLFAQFSHWYRPVTDDVRKIRHFAANRKWYKILPDDTKLAPLTIAVWFEGDGSTGWCPYPRVQLFIYTNSFTRIEVTRLSNLFPPFGILARVTQDSSGEQMAWVLHIGAIADVNTFFDLTEGHIHSCYRYKIKRAKHVSECKTEEERRIVCEHNKRQREYYKQNKNKPASLDPLFNNLRLSLRGKQ